MLEEYIKAQKAGQREYKARIAKGDFPFVPALDDIAPEINQLQQRDLGLMEIPMWMVKGTRTRARQNSFAANFMPILAADSEFAIKWQNLYQIQLDEGFRSPVKVYEYLHRFYVQEGNKRVSVSRYFDMPTIMANVTRVVPSEEVLTEHPVYREFLDFYKVCPIYDITCREPGSYRKIASLIGRDISPGAEKWPEDLVRSLQSAYWHFTQVLQSMNVSEPEKPTGEAFIVYLKIYAGDALSSKSNKELDQRLSKIRKELLTAQNNESVSLVESSEEAIKAADTPYNFIAKPSTLVGKVLFPPAYTKKKPLKCAFIYDRKPEVSNWTTDHDNGRKELEKAYDGLVKTKVFMGAGPATGSAAITENAGNTMQAIDAAARWGADVVFTITPTQLDDALRAAIKYENIKFLNCSVNMAHQAVRTYYAKLYEAKFLAGIVAAVYCDNHKIGYSSDYPIYGTIAAINAFALGAAMVDPEVKIYLEWRTKQDGNWWHTMEEQGIRVISAVNSTDPVDGSNAYGVFQIEDDGSFTHLASPSWKWGRFYNVIIKTILDGTYNASKLNRKDQAINYWWGMQSGVVDIKLEESISQHTKTLVNMLRVGLVNAAISPFDGEINSQEGCVRKEDDPELTSMDIIKMDWLCDNIVGEIPSKEALNDEAKATVSVSGVKEK